jgi:hypothetical protein
MTLEDESRLSFYKELTAIDEKKNIILVQNISDNQLYVKKMPDVYSKSVYEQLRNTHIDGIPDIVECIEDGDRLIVVEEYISGKNLAQIMKEKGLLDEDTACNVFLMIAQILTHLHRIMPPVIHRDIKPSNIIIDKAGNVYLIDFNAARNVDASKDEDTRMLGTMYFAAPEQYGFGQSDARTDIYGIGATINYCLTGNKPGAGIAKGKLTPILEKCLMIDAKFRYASAADLCVDLEKLKNNGANAENIKVGVSSWKKYLLPGFRKGNPVYCILAGMWYLMMIVMCTAMELTDKDGTVIEGMELTMNRLFLFITLVGSTLWYGNYLNVQEKFPGMSSESSFVRTLLMLTYGFLYALLTCTVMVALCSIFGID